MRGTDLGMVCEGLLSRVFHRPQPDGRGLVVEFTSAHPRAGVSHIANALAAALTQGGDDHTMLLNGRYMSAEDSGSAGTAQLYGGGASANLWQTHRADGSRDNWHGIQTRLAIYLENLRREYRSSHRLPLLARLSKVALWPGSIGGRGGAGGRSQPYPERTVFVRGPGHRERRRANSGSRPQQAHLCHPRLAASQDGGVRRLSISHD